MGQSCLERGVSWPQGKLALILLFSLSEHPRQLVTAQQVRNNQIASLIQTINFTYSIVIGSEVLKDEHLQDVLGRILKQTIECGYFIQNYKNRGKFLGVW